MWNKNIEANTETSKTSIEVFFACRLIPLYKNPDLRPVQVREIKRRISAKRVIQISKKDVMKDPRSLQLLPDKKLVMKQLSMLCMKHSMTIRPKQYFLLMLKMH